jgi:UDP-glucose 4-epimerase
LEFCARKRKSVLLTSTSKVYGKLDRPKLSEEDDLALRPTTKARWCYAASKIIDEFLAGFEDTPRRLPDITRI